MRIALFYKNNDKTNQYLEIITSTLIKEGFILDQLQPDVVLVLGGDGTLLRAIQYYIDQLDHISFVGLNSGTLGYFYDYNIDDFVTFINELKNNHFVENRYHLLQGIATFGEEEVSFYSLNEIRIMTLLETLECRVYINDEYLQDFYGNGLIVSSSLGSTGINKSFFGALVSPNIETLQLTSIGGLFNKSYQHVDSPIIFDEDTIIRIEAHHKNFEVLYDHLNLKNTPDYLEVSLSKKVLKLLNIESRSFVKALKKGFLK